MAIKKTKFRSASNQRFTAQLFYDMWSTMPQHQRLIPPMYSLHDDVEGCINFRKEYLADMDPSGYKTATRLLENYDHWQYLMRTKWFKAAKAEWDKELAAKMEAEASDVLRSIMRGDDESVKISEQISAAKVMLGKSKTIGKAEETLKRGRPSKEEVQGELKEQARLTKEEQEDLERITNINVAKKG